jgi:hypothetical protein
MYFAPQLCDAIDWPRKTATIAHTRLAKYVTSVEHNMFGFRDRKQPLTKTYTIVRLNYK